MNFRPLICVCVMLATAALAWADALPAEWGVGANPSLVTALIYLELALAPLALAPRPGRERNALAGNFAHTAACWACASAAVLLFGFLTTTPLGLESRVLSLCAWFCAGGVLTAAACIGARERARPLLIAAFGLPVLLHYLSLEYSGASQSSLAAISPHWLAVRGQFGPAWWLLGIGAASWVAAAVMSLWKRRAA